MKTKIILSFLILISFNSYSQEDGWDIYELDSIAFLDMPFEVFELDTIIDHTPSYKIFSEKNSTYFEAIKLYVGKRYSNIETPKLPNNKRGLNKFYIEIINYFDELIEYDFNYQKKIKYDNLEGYQLSYKDNKEKEVLQMQIFYLNKTIYVFSYLDSNGVNEKDKNTFFNSIFFNDEIELLQYPKMSLVKKLMISLLILLFLSFVYRFKPNRKTKK